MSVSRQLAGHRELLSRAACSDHKATGKIELTIRDLYDGLPVRRLGVCPNTQLSRDDTTMYGGKLIINTQHVELDSVNLRYRDRLLDPCDGLEVRRTGIFISAGRINGHVRIDSQTGQYHRCVSCPVRRFAIAWLTVLWRQFAARTRCRIDRGGPLCTLRLSCGVLRKTL